MVYHFEFEGPDDFKAAFENGLSGGKAKIERLLNWAEMVLKQQGPIPSHKSRIIETKKWRLETGWPFYARDAATHLLMQVQADKYQPKEGASFRNWADTVVENFGRAQLRISRRANEREEEFNPLTGLLGSDRVTDEGEPLETPRPELQEPARFDEALETEEALLQLSSRDPLAARIVVYTGEGYSQEEISNIEWPGENVGSHLSKIKRKKQKARSYFKRREFRV